MKALSVRIRRRAARVRGKAQVYISIALHASRRTWRRRNDSKIHEICIRVEAFGASLRVNGDVKSIR